MEALMDFSASLGVGRGSQKELSKDEIVEIFARLPVKSLMRFKCLSKFWYNLISSPLFIAMHTTHNHYKNNQVSLSLNTISVLSDRTTIIDFKFGDVTDTTRNLTFNDGSNFKSAEIVGCFNGVVCLSLSQRPQRYALWNPATRQVRQIGDSPMNGPDSTNMSDLALSHNNGGWYGSGFCFDPVTNAFKVVQMKLTVTEGGETRAQVNVFSTATNSWTEKNIPVPYRIAGSGCFNSIHGATCVNGYMHWHIAIYRGLDLDDMYILSYAMFDEVFKRIEIISRDVGYRLAAYKGSFSIFDYRRTGSDRSRTEVDVWVMNDCDGCNQSWTKLKTCRSSIKAEHASGSFSEHDDDLTVLLREERNSSLNLCDLWIMETKKTGSLSENFLYSESLASLN